MTAVRILRDIVRPDNKKAAQAGSLGLVDDADWSGSADSVPVLCEGRKNRVTLPRDALAPLLFGLWDPHEHAYLTDGAVRLEFSDPHTAQAMAADTPYVVAPLFAAETPWAPPAALEGPSPMVETLLALVRR